MTEANNTPLHCEVVNGVLRFQIGMATLSCAAAAHPDFWDGESGASTPNIKVIDPHVFAVEVANEINAEGEDGSTLLTRMLDAAMKAAVENGCEGVEHD